MKYIIAKAHVTSGSKGVAAVPSPPAGNSLAMMLPLSALTVLAGISTSICHIIG
jgi:hypothetical protein